jgi:hypothetical protein
MTSDDQAGIFVRIVELPSVRMARSGGKDLGEFDRWWSAVSAQDRISLFPRDFMWWNPRLNADEWLYALPLAAETGSLVDSGGYEVFDFPGGLYAVAACKDENSEIEKTSKLIHEWIARSEIFAEAPVDESNPRYEMGHVITPINAKEMMGHHQLDLFVPIVYRG